MVEKRTRKFNPITFLISIALIVCIPFIFNMKTITSSGEYRGFPFDWLAVYPSNGFSFKGLGFLVDVIVFYWLITVLVNKLKKKRKESQRIFANFYESLNRLKRHKRLP